MKTAEKTAVSSRRRIPTALRIGLLACAALLAYAALCLSQGDAAAARGALQVLLLTGWTGYVGWLFFRRCE